MKRPGSHFKSLRSNQQLSTAILAVGSLSRTYAEVGLQRDGGAVREEGAVLFWRHDVDGGIPTDVGRRVVVREVHCRHLVAIRKADLKIFKSGTGAF